MHDADALTAPREADGVICFGGEDWWYHNRGHFDFQLMRELSARVPVLYVNSIGMRTPRPTEGRMFLSRVSRKLRSLRRGLVRVNDRFAVLSPVAAPGRRGESLNRSFLPWQVRRAARRVGITRPLAWIACPPAAAALDALDPAGVVYQRTDRFEAYPHVDRERIAAYDAALKRRADLTLYCSRLLYDEEREHCRGALYVDHGVDYDRFEEAGRVRREPIEVASLPRPRAGFVGDIDAETFDPPLFVEVVRRLPEVHFLLVGACSLPEGWCPFPNVTMLGKRPYEAVAALMASCDVLLMPWNRSEWIRACNPIKLKEYLAVGRPIVTTPFDELRHYHGLVRIAEGPEQFADAIRAALAGDHDPAPGRARVARETWTAKAALVEETLRSRGVSLAARPGRAPGGPRDQSGPGTSRGTGAAVAR